MTTGTFAKAYLLNYACSEDGTKVIPGKHGHLYQYSDTETGVLVMPPPEQIRLWAHTRKAMVAAGMTVGQNGDYEGAVSFDPQDRKVAKLAIKLVGARRKRTCSPTQLAALLKARLSISIQSAAPAAL